METNTNLVNRVAKMLDRSENIEILKCCAKWHLTEFEDGIRIDIRVFDKSGRILDIFHIKANKKGNVKCNYVVSTIVEAFFAGKEYC